MAAAVAIELIASLRHCLQRYQDGMQSLQRYQDGMQSFSDHR
jgi:hypothetical protein